MMPNESRSIEDAEESERCHKQAALSAARSMLEEAGFDAVVLAATFTTESGDTEALHAMSGNWYAQNGLMNYILKEREEVSAIEAREKHESEQTE